LIDAVLRDFVRRRAGDRCEYCRLNQQDLPLSTFHVEHIVPRKHGGDESPSNLALACDRCNLYKGPNLTGLDPETGQITELFNPRTDSWDEHFELTGVTITGLSPKGRTTVRVLAMNEERRLRLREELKRRDL
jgi:hypothetical protein